MDTDFYKFTMGQVAFLKYLGVVVTYGFKNRTINVPLAHIIDEGRLREELDNVRTLSFSKSELHYLRGTNEYSDRMFCEKYLEFLENLQLPEYHLERDGYQFKLEFSGNWAEAIYWETLALSIINELYYEALMDGVDATRFERELTYAQGKVRLGDKIELLRDYPDITVTDFGTRRRRSRQWQDYVVGTMAEELPNQFIGTSNVKLAMDHDLLPMGTSAHEMYMVMSGIMHGSDHDIRSSHGQTLHDWWEQYGWGLSIALTDTYGSDFFFRDFNSIQAERWKGLRHDSGDPIEFGEKAISFYEGYGIDPMEKLLIFSDGLDVNTIIRIADHFRGRINSSFGWGTNLTNDLGFGTLSLVVKATMANGNPTVKLSDNLAKAMGPEKDVERFKNIFDHTNTFNEECVV
jgi:nicotinate phosphoribosyltransferase